MVRGESSRHYAIPVHAPSSLRQHSSAFRADVTSYYNTLIKGFYFMQYFTTPSPLKIVEWCNSNVQQLTTFLWITWLRVCGWNRKLVVNHSALLMTTACPSISDHWMARSIYVNWADHEIHPEDLRNRNGFIYKHVWVSIYIIKWKGRGIRNVFLSKISSDREGGGIWTETTVLSLLCFCLSYHVPTYMINLILDWLIDGWLIN